MYYKKYDGDNIFFSPLRIEDYKLYTKWINDEKISRAINQVHKVITEESEKEWIYHAYEKGRYQFAVINKKNNQPIGIYGLELKNDISKKYYFAGFIGEEEYRGKGIGTEALKLLTKYAFEILNAHSLYTTIYDFNEVSLKSAVKAGFEKCGELKETVFYDMKYYDEIIVEMTEEEYRKKYKEMNKNE